LESLSASGFQSPTLIQARGIPAVLRGGHVLLAGATGSGKTIAYIAPLLDMLSRPEETRTSIAPDSSIADGGPAKLRGPRAILLVPNRELVYQVGAAVASLQLRSTGFPLSFATVFSVDGLINLYKRQDRIGINL
jgi:ATP-dependent RNA helicase RhlE